MAIVTIEIDLAKSVFAVHGVNEFGKPELVRPKVLHAKLIERITNVPAMPDRHASVRPRLSLGT